MMCIQTGLKLLICSGLSFTLTGYSNEPTSARTPSRPDATAIESPSVQAPRSTLGQYPEVVVLESDETKDRNRIQQQARSLLAAKDYELLDKLAADLRLNKDAYVDGYWKLWAFY